MEIALFNDCIHLIERFVEQRDPSFAAFCNVWKRMQFQYIYTMQTTHTEILNTTEVIFHVTKRTICARNVNGELLYTPVEDEVLPAMMRRIGAIYLMYAIYFKQPTQQFVKVSVSPKTWLEMQAFLETLPETLAARREVNFIFYQLVQAQAFRFTAMDYSSGLENLIVYDKVQDGENNESGLALRQELRAVNTMEKMLPALCKLEKHYNAAKKEIIAKGTAGLTAKSLPITTVFQQLQSVLGKVRSIIEESDVDQPTTSKQAKHDKNMESNKKICPVKMAKPTHHVLKDQLSNEILNDLQGSESEESDDNNSCDNNAEAIVKTNFMGLEMLLDDGEDIEEERTDAPITELDDCESDIDKDIAAELQQFLRDERE